MKDKNWFKHVLDNTENSPYCAQERIIKKYYELEPISLEEIEKMMDEPPKTFEQIMEENKNEN